MKKPILALMFANLIALGSAQACGSYGDPNQFWLEVLNGSDSEIEARATTLRKQGQSALKAALRLNGNLKAHPNYPTFVEQIAKQRDAARSGLYWHTDFDKALALAKETERPILSLRLLGNLDEEYSCANSRLFREVLYPDPEVNKFLRDNFVLHWKSVRPVPVMTVDFGDGRKLKRTITGNSAHYILDQRGRVVDALPGLYTPEKFLADLRSGHQFVGKYGDACSRSQPGALARFHKDRLTALEMRFKIALGGKNLKPVLSSPIEMGDLTPEQWAMVADAEAREIKVKAALANELTRGKMVMEAPLITEFTEAELNDPKRKKLAGATSIDSVRNEFVLHRQVHQHLSDGRNHTDIDSLNKWVYAELFLMPDNDPWLGLNTPDVFTGLKDNGVVSK